MALKPGMRMNWEMAFIQMRRTSEILPAIHGQPRHRGAAMEVIRAQHLRGCRGKPLKRQRKQQTPHHQPLVPAMELKKCRDLHARRDMISRVGKLPRMSYDTMNSLDAGGAARRRHRMLAPPSCRNEGAVSISNLLSADGWRRTCSLNLRLHTLAGPPATTSASFSPVSPAGRRTWQLWAAHLPFN